MTATAEPPGRRSAAVHVTPAPISAELAQPLGKASPAAVRVYVHRLPPPATYLQDSIPCGPSAPLFQAAFCISILAWPVRGENFLHVFKPALTGRTGRLRSRPASTFGPAGGADAAATPKTDSKTKMSSPDRAWTGLVSRTGLSPSSRRPNGYSARREIWPARCPRCAT
jgi:hypothetical protein